MMETATEVICEECQQVITWAGSRWVHLHNGGESCVYLGRELATPPWGVWD